MKVSYDSKVLAETVAVAVYNGADRGNYLKETVEVTITRMQQGVPYVNEINGEGMEVIVNGWDAVKSSVSAAQTGDEIVVEVNGAGYCKHSGGRGK